MQASKTAKKIVQEGIGKNLQEQVGEIGGLILGRSMSLYVSNEVKKRKNLKG